MNPYLLRAALFAAVCMAATAAAVRRRRKRRSCSSATCTSRTALQPAGEEPLLRGRAQHAHARRAPFWRKNGCGEYQRRAPMTATCSRFRKQWSVSSAVWPQRPTAVSKTLQHVLHALPRQHRHGQGIVIKKGMVAPPSLHDERIRHMPDGQLFATISHGVRNMPAYSYSIPVDEDRWAIVSYVRALQLSQAGE